MEPHWERYNKLCHVCDVKYDFIGKFDTLRDDIAFVLRQIYRSADEYYFPNVNTARSSVGRMEYYYKQLDQDLIQKLEETFKLDYELFGYQFNTISWHI